MKKAFLFLLLFALSAGSLPAQDNSDSPAREMPPDFKSDGCTLFPDGKYRDCCVRHDEVYFFGGSCRERSKADAELYRCVASKKGWYHRAIIAPVMWIGVRIGGVSFLPTPFRWGFGKKKSKRAPVRRQKRSGEKRNKNSTGEFQTK